MSFTVLRSSDDIAVTPASATTRNGAPASGYVVVPDGASVVVLVTSPVGADVVLALPDDRTSRRCQ